MKEFILNFQYIFFSYINVNRWNISTYDIFNPQYIVKLIHVSDKRIFTISKNKNRFLYQKVAAGGRLAESNSIYLQHQKPT